MSNPTPSYQGLDDAISNLTDFRKQNEAPDKADLKANIDKWKKMSYSSDPFYAMMVWGIRIVGDGGMWSTQLSEKNGFTNDSSGYLTSSGDQISDVALQQEFGSAFGVPLTQDVQNNFNSSGNINTMIGTDSPTSTGCGLLQNTLEQHPELFGGVGSTTYTQLTQSVTKLTADLNEIADPAGQWGGSLATFFTDVSDKNDSTGAAALNNDITQQMSTVSQTLQTVQGTLGEQMKFATGTQQQWVGFIQNMFKSMMAVWEQTTAASKGGS